MKSVSFFILYHVIASARIGDSTECGHIKKYNNGTRYMVNTNLILLFSSSCICLARPITAAIFAFSSSLRWLMSTSGGSSGVCWAVEHAEERFLPVGSENNEKESDNGVVLPDGWLFSLPIPESDRELWAGSKNDFIALNISNLNSST